MSGDLDDVRLKLRRAKEHAEALHNATATFHWLDANQIRVEVDAEANELLVIASLRERTPREWGPLFGDFIHNLRSALDHLAIALVLRNKPTAHTRRTAFPIFERDPRRPNSPAADKEGWRNRVRNMGPEAKEAIRAIQPFSQPVPTGLTNTLKVLGDLSNLDKHRGMVPIGVVAGVAEVVRRRFGGWELGAAIPVPQQPIDRDTVVARFALIPLEHDPDVEVDVGVRVGFSITVEEGVPPGTLMDEILRFLYTRVLDIVNDFETRFF